VFFPGEGKIDKLNNSFKNTLGTDLSYAEGPPVRSLLSLCLFALTCLCLLLFVNLPSDRLVWSSVQNVGHFVLFAVLASAYFFHMDKTSDWRYFHKAFFTFFILTAIGIVAEVAQVFLPTRSASFADIGRNLLGVSVGILTYDWIKYRKKLNKKLLSFCLLALVSVTFWICKPAFQLITYNIFKSPSPVVMSFGDPFVKSMISKIDGASFALVENNLSTKKDWLLMEFSRYKYSGIVIHEPQANWANYEYLSLTFLNKSDAPVMLEVRIHDVQHDNSYQDRFNTKLNIKPGESTIKVPLEDIRSLGRRWPVRRMNLQQISQLQLFTSTENNQLLVYLADIVLTRD